MTGKEPGMTRKEPGMTRKEPGMTGTEPGMTGTEPGMTGTDVAHCLKAVAHIVSFEASTIASIFQNDRDKNPLIFLTVVPFSGSNDVSGSARNKKAACAYLTHTTLFIGPVRKVTAAGPGGLRCFCSDRPR